MLDPMIGWSLIIIGVIFFIIEILVPGQTFLMVFGTFFCTLGVIAIATGDETFTFGPGIGIAVLMTVVAAVVTFAIYKKLGTVQKPTTTVAESLVGERGMVTKKIIPHEITGKIKVGTTEWSARSDEEIEVGKHVEIVDSKGVHVVVVEVEPPKKGELKRKKKMEEEMEEDDLDEFELEEGDVEAYDDYDK